MASSTNEPQQRSQEHSVNAVIYDKVTDNNILSRFCIIDSMDTSPVLQVHRGDTKDVGCECHDIKNKNKKDVFYRCDDPKMP
jgi:hypothetical protein